MPWTYIIFAGILAFMGWWSTQPLGYVPFLGIPIPNPLQGYSTVFYVAGGLVFVYGWWKTKKGDEK